MNNIKYKEDKSDPELNTNSLNNEFNIDSNKINKEIEKVQSMRKELLDIEKDQPDVDKIILNNIDRANNILDHIEKEIYTGNANARQIEVVGQLINAVTTAATSITGISYNQQIIDNKNRSLDIKEKELTVKGIIKGVENVNITNNNLVMNREEVLKMLDEK